MSVVPEIYVFVPLSSVFIICFSNSINIADDTIWEDLTVKTSIYTNTIKWGNYSSKQTAHVNRNVTL